MTPEQATLVEWEEIWTGDFVFENEWQSFRTKKDRSLELTSVYHPGRWKIAVKVVDIFWERHDDDYRGQRAEERQEAIAVVP